MAKPLVPIRFLIQYSNNYLPILLFMTSHSIFSYIVIKTNKSLPPGKLALQYSSIRKVIPHNYSTIAPLHMQILYTNFSLVPLHLYSRHTEESTIFFTLIIKVSGKNDVQVDNYN
jgi:hypothetical protein